MNSTTAKVLSVSLIGVAAVIINRVARKWSRSPPAHDHQNNSEQLNKEPPADLIDDTSEIITYTKKQDSDWKNHELFPYHDDLLDNRILDKRVLDTLISMCILMIEDREEINKPTTQRERNKVLLDILAERPFGIFKVFRDILKESDSSHDDIKEIVNNMHWTENSDEQFECHEINLNIDAIRIQKNYELLINNIVSTTDVTDYLIGELILDFEDQEEICAPGLTKNESNRRLLDKLLYKNGYIPFLKALQHAGYTDIANEVSTTEVTEQDQSFCQIGLQKLKARQRIKEKYNKELQMMHSRIEDLAHTQDAAIPKNIIEQFKKRLKQWKDDDQKFVSIDAEKQVMRHILKESCVTLIGNSGTGKTFLSRHIALKMMKQGYDIIPCENPENMIKWFKHGRKTVFVFEDVCGRYSLNKQMSNDWKKRLDHITSLLADKCCKIMATCRLDIYKDEIFNSLSIFKTIEINLSSEKFKLNAAEKLTFAKVYLQENAGEVAKLSEKYDCFPLLCSLYYKQNLKEHVNIQDFFSYPMDIFEKELCALYKDGDAGKMKYCTLVLCVMFNNTLLEGDFSLKNKKTLAIIEEVLDKCELTKGTSIEHLKKSLETLEGTYIVKEDSTYKIIHDKLFDFLAKYFGEKMLQLFIDHANIDIVNERFIWKTTDIIDKGIDFAIIIPDNLINTYIDRLVQDWENGYIMKVFTNKNMTSLQFTETFIRCFNKIDQPKQEKLATTEDIEFKDTALGINCLSGFGNLVKWLISIKSDINHSGKGGVSPLHFACEKGDVGIVEELIKHSAELNQSDRNGKTPLYIASHEGHADVVKKLIQNSAEVNQCDKDGISPLYVASQQGHAGVVKELLLHSPDVNRCSNIGVSPLSRASYFNETEVVEILLQCDQVDINAFDDNGRTSLYWACATGHVAVVKKLLQHAADVNQGHNNEASPLYIASQHGHVNVVKELLQYSPDVHKCKQDGDSPLSIASFLNKTEVVKILLQCDEVCINLCDNNGRSALYWAILNGHVDVVKELIQHSANVNQCDNDGKSPLYKASAIGHVDVVNELLKYSPEVNKCNKDGDSPLTIASYFNKPEVVKVLLQCDKVDIDLCDYGGRSALYLASLKGHVDVVKELLKHSANINQCNNDGKSPLYKASAIGNVDVVNELLKFSPDVNKCSISGFSPLSRASFSNNTEVVKILLQCDEVDINLCDEDGRSPLYWASEKGQIDVVKELIQHSAEVNKCANDGASPLYTASQKGHVDVVKELIQHSPDVNKCSNVGDSPLSIASYFNKTEVVKILLQCDEMDINLCDENGHSPLFCASQAGHVDVVKELIQHSANVNQCGNDGKSPLYIASANEHVDVVNELLKYSPDVNKCNEDGDSPLSIASYFNKLEVVKVLLQCNEVDINLCDNKGKSALYLASQEGHDDVVNELLQHLADINIGEAQGKTPLRIAQEQGNVAVEALLLGKQ